MVNACWVDAQLPSVLLVPLASVCIHGMFACAFTECSQEVATIVAVGYLAFYIANAPLGVSGERLRGLSLPAVAGAA